jgi:hypothetical protein
MIFFDISNHLKIIEAIKHTMADKIKMAAKHEVSIAQSIFMQIN